MPDPVADPHILEPGHAPTPFTAEEIRAGCPDGRTIRLLVEVDGAPTGLQTNRFHDGDAEGATIEAQRLTLSGEPVGPPERARVTWLGLQGHASFPADSVTIEPDVITTPLGHLDCLRYTRANAAGIDRFWFATSLPGMPALYETERDGRVVLRVTMTENARS